MVMQSGELYEKFHLGRMATISEAHILGIGDQYVFPNTSQRRDGNDQMIKIGFPMVF